MAGLTSAKMLKSISMPLALCGILMILMLPVPTIILDICIALNVTISMIILFGSLFMERILSFSSFPAVLLVTTLFRLAMNVASTRMILLNGNQGLGAAGSVIQAFGEFVVGGNFAVGAVIFLVITIVNLKVITKGSTRIAEVAARFTLDAMPGKQMAIDSDLNSGLIKEAEAKTRRLDLQREAEFYGAMDGAAKFVSGDAVAGFWITGINIVGGFFIGVVMLGMDWKVAAETFMILTIGDGLVSQIPAIIISTAAGLIVARAASTGEDLGTEVLGQLGMSEKPLWITSGACAALAIIPGLPFLPFITLAAITSGAAFYRRKQVIKDQQQERLDKIEVIEDENKPKAGSTEEVTGLLGLDTLELEVGYELVSLVESSDLLERIRSIRRQFALDYGFVVPAIHIRDNVRLTPNEYRLMLKGNQIGKGVLKTQHLLAMDPGSVTAPVEGEKTTEPAFGLDALWIRDTDKERAQFAGYTVVDLSTVITTHLTELVRSNMSELLGRQEVQHLLDNVAKEAPKLIEELVPSVLSVGQIQQVLSLLLREEISIRDIRTILETLADWGVNIKQPERLASYVRRRLSRTITKKFISDDGRVSLVSLSPALEKTLNEALQQADEGTFIAMEPARAQVLINKLNKAGEQFLQSGLTPLLLAPAHLRAALFSFVSRFVPGYAVISHQELAPSTKVQSLGVISLEG
jgi:flagellar biosynthesis protein FlhA